ncbi:MULTISPECIES: TIGR04255 family protein [unclassified Phaeobacter]|uniref:TIGR04255 family protein n=1 Tax=unclassified Phaeobacter TaxID=2621772 RepID=UPI003A8A6286
MTERDMPNRSNDPLFGAVPASVPLDNAPLVRVLAQVRFTKVAKIGDENYIADFQEAIRQEYPHFHADKIRNVELIVNDDGIAHKEIETTVWRFFDPQKAIRVSLNTESISLETSQYTSRQDFLDRMQTLLVSLCETINPSLALRVGFRYVDRLTDQGDLASLSSLVQPELLNVVQPNLTDHIEVSMTEVVSKTQEGKLIARYGKAPPNYSHEPEMAPPVQQSSWVLDIDSFSTACKNTQLNPVFLRQELDKVAARAYAFFRWSVTDEFLNRFGAK